MSQKGWKGQVWEAEILMVTLMEGKVIPTAEHTSPPELQ